MSWNSYVSNLKAQSESIDKGCIIGLDGSIWTQASDITMSITPTEASTIAQIMKSQDYQQFQTNGITIEGVKYTFLRSVDKAVYGKKCGSGGVTMQAANSAIVIGHCKEGTQQGAANQAVYRIAEYLESTGL